MERAEIEAEVKRRDWFHTMEVLPGLWTKGHYKPDSNWLFGLMEMPERFAGLSALDLGCADGAHSFEMVRRGANVTAVDLFSSGYRNIEFLSQVWNLPIEYRQESIYTLAGGPFDLILASGVLYHLEHPMLGLQCLNKLSKGELILESQIETGLRLRGQNVCRFWPDSGLNNDPSNWWTPTRTALKSMLESCGFEILLEKEHAPSRVMTKVRKVRDVFPALSAKDVFNRCFGQDPY